MEPLETPRTDRHGATLPSVNADEFLAEDPRAALTPSEMVEQKLFALLESNPFPASRLLARPAGRSRPPNPITTRS